MSSASHIAAAAAAPRSARARSHAARRAAPAAGRRQHRAVGELDQRACVDSVAGGRARLQVEHLARPELLALERSTCSRPSTSRSSASRRSTPAVEEALDLRVDLTLGLRVPVPGERLDECAPRLEVQLANLRMAAHVEVDGAFVGGGARAARARRVPSLRLAQVAGPGCSPARRSAGRRARPGSPRGAQREAPAPLDQRALRGERLAVRRHARTEDVRVECPGRSAPSCAAQTRCGRGGLPFSWCRIAASTGRLEELVGVPAEELSRARPRRRCTPPARVRGGRRAPTSGAARRPCRGTSRRPRRRARRCRCRAPARPS